MTEWTRLDSTEHPAPRDGTVIELRCAGSEIKRAQWGKWKYRRGTDEWWCSPEVGWTLSRHYAPDAWRPPPPKDEG